jgi:hypothetical protein
MDIVGRLVHIRIFYIDAVFVSIIGVMTVPGALSSIMKIMQIMDAMTDMTAMKILKCHNKHGCDKYHEHQYDRRCQYGHYGY